jgi:hypothetical protein
VYLNADISTVRHWNAFIAFDTMEAI